MLFETWQRTEIRPKQLVESEYRFLDRCASVEVENIRSFLNECISLYPATHAQELVGRLQSDEEGQFSSATFELLLFRACQNLGFDPVVHPTLPHTAAKPDFCVTLGTGSKCYVEAVGAAEDDGRDQAAEKRKNLALQYIDQRPHARYMIGISESGEPTTQPSGKRFHRAIVHWLDSLDFDTVRAAIGEHHLTLRHEGWEVVVSPYPLNPAAHGKSTRLIGSRSWGGAWIDGWQPIRNAVMKKYRSYGDLGAPLIVAVNMSGMALSPIDEVQALFGQEQTVYTQGGYPPPHLQRAPNGAWYGPNGARGNRCSGAWLFDRLTVYEVHRRNTLYKNPASIHAVPDAFNRFGTSEVRGDRLHACTGDSLGAVLGLPIRWPHQVGPRYA
jgi:hypothetical protein